MFVAKTRIRRKRKRKAVLVCKNIIVPIVVFIIRDFKKFYLKNFGSFLAL